MHAIISQRKLSKCILCLLNTIIALQCNDSNNDGRARGMLQSNVCRYHCGPTYSRPTTQHLLPRHHGIKTETSTRVAKSVPVSTLFTTNIIMHFHYRDYCTVFTIETIVLLPWRQLFFTTKTIMHFYHRDKHAFLPQRQACIFTTETSMHFYHRDKHAFLPQRQACIFTTETSIQFYDRDIQLYFSGTSSNWSPYYITNLWELDFKLVKKKKKITRTGSD